MSDDRVLFSRRDPFIVKNSNMKIFSRVLVASVALIYVFTCRYIDISKSYAQGAGDYFRQVIDLSNIEGFFDKSEITTLRNKYHDLNLLKFFRFEYTKAECNLGERLVLLAAIDERQKVIENTYFVKFLIDSNTVLNTTIITNNNVSIEDHGSGCLRKHVVIFHGPNYDLVIKAEGKSLTHRTVNRSESKL